MLEKESGMPQKTKKVGSKWNALTVAGALLVGSGAQAIPQVRQIESVTSGISIPLGHAPEATKKIITISSGDKLSQKTKPKTIIDASTDSEDDTSFFETKGTRIYARGKEFKIRGISVIDDLNQLNGLTPHYEAATDAQIKAAARYWHVNTIRLQISQDVFLNHPTPGYAYNMEAMERLRDEIKEIVSLGMTPEINDCRLFTNGRMKDPTKATLKFWKIIPEYLSEQKDIMQKTGIIFDVYNEPVGTGGWRGWQKGSKHYVGEQQLVNEIRGERNSMHNNLIVVEGPEEASTLNGLDKDPIEGRNIVFAYHHPKLDKPWTWGRDTGVNLKRKVPVLDDEWAEYASATRKECYSDAPQEVSGYLHFLDKHHIGIILWSLQQGVLVYSDHPKPAVDTVTKDFPTDPAALSQPDSFGRNYSCTTGAIRHGVGSIMMDYFKKESHQKTLPTLAAK